MSEDPTAADVVEAVAAGAEIELPPDPALVAHSLRLTGKSWAAVAAEARFPSGRAAALAVAVMLQAAALARDDEAGQQALELELERLDALHLAYWGSAIAGDLKAAKYVLEVSKQRAALERWVEAPKAAGPRMIIITGEDMAEQLRRQVEGPDELDG